MSKRTDIIDPATELSAPVGLVYSEILGWIDLGHALGRDIRKILEQMAIGEKESAPYYEVTYSQSMYQRNHTLGTGVYLLWMVKKGTPLHIRHSIVLAMMMITASRFESRQASVPFHGLPTVDLARKILFQICLDSTG